jgi:hypothetical protein
LNEVALRGNSIKTENNMPTNIFTVIGTTKDANATYPGQQAQIIPSMGDATRFKIPGRGRQGMFGFSCADYKNEDAVRQFHGSRAVVLLQTSRSGNVVFQDVFYDWDCLLQLTTPDGDPPSTLVAQERSFRYGYYFQDPTGSSSGYFSQITPYAGFETVVAICLYDVANDTYAGSPSSVLGVQAGATIPYPTGVAVLYAGNASGITQTT